MSKTVVITGAGRGIGKSIALKFASEGYHVVIHYLHDEQGAYDVLKQCEAFGVECMLYQGDVRDEKAMDLMMKSVVERFSTIDVLVNNSGITKDQLLVKMDSQAFNDVIDVNLKGTFHTMKAVSRIMMKQRSGVIINMSSVIGIIGNVGQANYAASKAGVIALTKSIAKELAARHIRVNAIAPGFIETKMTDVLSQETKNAILNQIPLKEMGKAEDVAAVAYFLASEDARYITGQVIHVDGGMVM